MADRIVMGYWDCKYCGTTGIEGVKRDCPNCGHPRDKDTVFYMKSQSHEEVVRNNEYLTDKQAETKGKGADWECSFCGALNSTLSDSCKSCGHPREESDPDYFQVRAREDGLSAGQSGSAGITASPSRTVSQQQVQAEETSPFSWKRIIIAALILMGILGLVLGLRPRAKTLHIQSRSWEYSVHVEENRYVPDSGWSLPAGADLDRTAREIHHYNSVLDHYETKTRTWQERVQIGSHTEYSYSDNGDGTFTERSYEVPDYGYETRSETYQDPVYVQVPVYETKYYYHLWRWEYSRSVETSGTDSEPYFGDPNLNNLERQSGTSKRYYLNCTEGKDSETLRQYTIDESDWYQVQSGTSIRAMVQGSRITELKDE